MALAGGEGAERVDRALAVGAGALDRVVERAAVLEQPDGAARSSSAARLPAIASRQKRALVVGAAGIGEDDRQGDLAVAEIVADALAHRRRVGGIVDRVVDQLEGDAEVAAIGVERLLDRLAALGDDRGDPAGGGEQGRGLGAG